MSIESIPVLSGASVCAIGVFDGVHRGHQVLLARARTIADEHGLPLVAVTFDPHPLAVVRPSAAPPLLTTVDARIGLLRDAGADDVVILRFDTTMAALSPQDFVERVLVERLHARAVVVGENFTFGKGAKGTAATLAELGPTHGFTAEAVGLQRTDIETGAASERISSSAIRALVAAGDVATAARLLGREFFTDGVVVHGDHRGRELGIPTANLPALPGLVVPADGIYAGWLTLRTDGAAGPAGTSLPGAISVGVNPQFDGTERRIETHVLASASMPSDDLDLYGAPVRVRFTARVRGQEVFDSLDDFLARIGEDLATCRRILGTG